MNDGGHLEDDDVRAMRALVAGMTNQGLGKFIGDVLNMSPPTPRTLVIVVEELATRAKKAINA